jgi:hypothetical protein
VGSASLIKRNLTGLTDYLCWLLTLMRLKKVEDMVVESLDSKWEKLPADLGSHEAGSTNGTQITNLIGVSD